MFNTLLLFYVPLMLGTLVWNGLVCLLVFLRRRNRRGVFVMRTTWQRC